MEYDEILDSSGLYCPIPILNLTKAMRKMEAGKVIRVISTDIACEKNVEIFVKRHKYVLLHTEKEDDKFIFYIKKNN